MKILGIDYGRSKIGLAIGDSETKIAQPLEVQRNVQCTIYNVQKIVKECNIDKLLIGLPDGKMDEEIKRFGEELKKQTGVEVEYFDETLTTQDAQKVLLRSGKSRRLRKKSEDAVAAALMLQWYLETRIVKSQC